MKNNPMNIVCPNCEYHKQRAQIWRDEAYRLAGHPLPRKETSMTQDEIIEMAKQAGFVEKDALFRSVYLANIKDLEAFAKLIAEREREACAKIADEWAVGWPHPSEVIAERIRARGQA